MCLKRILNIMAKRKKKVKPAEEQKTIVKMIKEEKPINKIEFPETFMRLNKGAINQVPGRIVIHAMSEYIDGLFAVDFLKSIGLSVHALICPNGKVIRCRLDNEGAYHAKEYNNNSLGVEFLVKGEHSYPSFLSAIQRPYLTEEQYEAGVKLVKQWISKYEIIKVWEHSWLSPGRKFDPGPGFSLYRFEEDIETKINSGI